MAINLSKGQTINLDKNVNDLSMVTIGLGWKVRQKKKGFFGKMFGAEDLTGGTGGDDERIIVKLNELPAQYTKIVFLVVIYQGRTKNQHFGLIDNAFIRAVDAKGKEIARYSLSEDASYENQCSMIFGEVYRKDGEWKFRATGNAYYADSFVEILKQYV